MKKLPFLDLWTTTHVVPIFREEARNIQNTLKGGVYSMLAVQVQYWNYVETAKHNRETERQGLIELSQQQQRIDETVRHDKETEQIQWFQAREQSRHNYETERIGWANVTELNRHNLATEAIGRESNAIARLQAQNSALQARAALQQASAALQNAATNKYNAATQKKKVLSEIGLNSKKAKLVEKQTATEKQRARQVQLQANYDYARTVNENNKSMYYDLNEMRAWIPLLGGNR